MSEVTNKEFREVYPSHFTSERALNHAFRVFLGSSLAAGLLASCVPKGVISTLREIEAFNLFNRLLEQAGQYSKIETKEAQKLLGLEELVVADASREYDVTINWGKVSQLPDTEWLEGKRLSMIFIDEFTPTMEEWLKKTNLDPDSTTSFTVWSFTAGTRDGQIAMVFPLGKILIPETPANFTEEHNHSASDIVNLHFLHEFAHVLQMCRVGLKEYSQMRAADERYLETQVDEYVQNNLQEFMGGVKIIRRAKEESRLTPEEEHEVQAFFHWLGVRQRLLEGKDEAPYFLRSKV